MLFVCHSGMLIFYLNAISVFPWFITFQTLPIHGLYALDLLIWCAIFFCHYNLKKEELLFPEKVAKSRSRFTLGWCTNFLPNRPPYYSGKNYVYFSHWLFYPIIYCIFDRFYVFWLNMGMIAEGFFIIILNKKNRRIPCF